MSHSHLPMLQVEGVEPPPESIFALMVDTVTDYAIFLLDPNGVIRTWNPGAQRIKGYLPDEIIGQHFSVFYDDALRAAKLPEHELEVAGSTGHFEDEGWRLRKDGSRFWANVVITALRDADGRLLGFSKITRDLSERREREEQLRRSEERFRLMVEGVRDYAIFMLDPDGNVASWNAGAQLNKGYAPEEILGKHFSTFYPAEQVEAGWPTEELRLALAQGSFEDEGWRLRKDGSRFWASVVITPLHDADGAHFGFAKVTRDLTERRRVHALEDEGRRINTFLAMLGHELRNPLAPIMGAVSVMQLEHVESARLRQCRDIIARQLQHMVRLVDDLLDVGRISSGKINLDLQSVAMAEVVADAVEMVQPLVTERRHTLSLALPEVEVWVKGDRARLLQVACNLLTNAAKYTPLGGQIHVALQHADGFVELRVRDNGLGIAPEYLNDIFKLFVQVDSRTEVGGLGLGLSLVHQLVTLHHGEISVFSTGEPGKGSEFVVRLPVAPGSGVVDRQ